MNQEAQGIACALAGAVLWGCSGSFSQFLFSGYGFSGLGLTAVRMTVSGLLFLAAIAALRRPVLAEIRRDRHARRSEALFGAAGLFLNQLTYLMTIAYTNAGTATVMQSFSIPLIMVVVCVMLHRRPAPREVIALVCALASIFLISTGGNPATLALPVAATVLSAAWLGTAFSTADWAGLALMVGTILISSMPMPQKA